MDRSLMLTHGWLLVALSALLTAPSLTGILLPPPDPLLDAAENHAFLATQLATLLAGILMLAFSRGSAPIRITIRDGFLIAASSWIVVGIFSALPFWLSGVIPDPVDALFESVSGLTTTGASVITDLTVVPNGLMLWRALTQWLGGIGIVVLFVAALPLVAEGSHNLFRAEVPGGANFAKVTPRVRETAR
ncbi:MAG: TrkH family potassium uptake protein, partial [Nitrospinae bacterium]|nr:TrkH family potassium uptake protein [Nitrospinota bacterium]